MDETFEAAVQNLVRLYRAADLVRDIRSGAVKISSEEDYARYGRELIEALQTKSDCEYLHSRFVADGVDAVKACREATRRYPR